MAPEVLRHAVARLVHTLRYKSKSRGFEPQWCHIRAALWPWGRLSLLTETSTRYIFLAG